jgi:hypothetical protein
VHVARVCACVPRQLPVHHVPACGVRARVCIVCACACACVRTLHVSALASCARSLLISVFARCSACACSLHVSMLAICMRCSLREQSQTNANCWGTGIVLLDLIMQRHRDAVRHVEVRLYQRVHVPRRSPPQCRLPPLLDPARRGASSLPAAPISSDEKNDAHTDIDGHVLVLRHIVVERDAHCCQ